MIVDIHMHAHDEYVRHPRMFDPNGYLADRREVDLGIIGIKFRAGSMKLGSMAAISPDAVGWHSCSEP